MKKNIYSIGLNEQLLLVLQVYSQTICELNKTFREFTKNEGAYSETICELNQTLKGSKLNRMCDGAFPSTPSGSHNLVFDIFYKPGIPSGLKNK